MTVHKPHSELFEEVRGALNPVYTTSARYANAIDALAYLEEQLEAANARKDELWKRLLDIDPTSSATASTDAVSPAPGHQRSDLPESRSESSPASSLPEYVEFEGTLADGLDEESNQEGQP